jgi:hypothetical protein
MFSVTKNEDEGMVVSEEEWGYSLTLTNRTAKPLQNIRIEYVLFAKPDQDPGKDKTAAILKRTNGSTTVKEIAGNNRAVVRTDTIKIYKQKLKPGFVWKDKGGSDTIRDTLYGVWIKAYVGEQVVAEICNPSSLGKTEKGP